MTPILIIGTGGNTGIGLALVSAAKGYKSCFAMSKTLAKDKIEAMSIYGSEVVLTSGGFATPGHYFHTAKRRAAETKGGFWANQFDNEANFRSHIEGTGPEIVVQTKGQVDGFICSSGTGGTISGVSQYFKSLNNGVTCAIIDCEGSALLDFVNLEQKAEDIKNTDIEGYQTKLVPTSPGDSIAEGIGINRISGNFARAQIDKATQGTNQEVVDMVYYLLQKEGLNVGPSAALNVVGAVKLARELGPGKTIVTVLCDSGERYKTKIFNKEWLAGRGLEVDSKNFENAASLKIGAWNWKTPKEGEEAAPAPTKASIAAAAAAKEAAEAEAKAAETKTEESPAVAVPESEKEVEQPAKDSKEQEEVQASEASEPAAASETEAPAKTE